MKNQKCSLKEVESRLKEVTSILESTVLRKDIYDNMRGCLKKDIIVLKKRYFDKDIALMRDKTKLKSLRT